MLAFNKSLGSIALGFLFSLLAVMPSYAQFYGDAANQKAAQYLRVGYAAKQDIPVTEFLESTSKNRSRMVVEPGRLFTDYIGDKIVGAYICVNGNLPGATVGLREGHMMRKPFEKKVVDLKKGWNTIIFDNPHVITAEDAKTAPAGGALSLGIGYDADFPKGDESIAFDWNTEYSPRAALFMSDGFGALADLGIEINVKALVLPLIVTNNPEKSKNYLRVCDIQTVKNPTWDKPLDTKIVFYNAGTNDVNTAKVAFSGSLEGEHTFTFEQPIKPNETRVVAYDFNFDTSTQPFTAAFVATVLATNGQKMSKNIITGASKNITFKADGGGDDQGSSSSSEPAYYTRFSLLEKFTDLLCSNCPGAQKNIEWAIEDDKDLQKRMVLVSQHGLREPDKFLMPHNHSMLKFFPGKKPFAPGIMIDRKISNELFGNYINSSTTEFRLAKAMKAALKEKAYARLLKCKIEGNNVIVQGQIAPSFRSNPNVRLTVYIMDSDIYANQLGGGPNYQQKHTIIFTPTDFAGAPLQLDEKGHFTYVFSIERSAKTKELLSEGDYEIAALVHLTNPDASVPQGNEVLNAFCFTNDKMSNDTDDSGNTAVEEIAQAPAVKVFVQNGNICVEGEYVSAEVFDMSGLRFHITDALPKGVYLVKVLLPNNNVQVFKINI